MDRDFFINAGLQFEPSWRSTNHPPEQAFSDRFNQSSLFESVLSSMGSSPVSIDRELAGKPSPEKLSMPIMDHFVKESFPRSRNSMAVNPNLPLLASDPGFAERAARFSCFGSRSFNGRSDQLGLNSDNPEFQFRSSGSPATGKLKIPRVSSTPLLKIDRSPVGLPDNKNSDELGSKFSRLSGSAANSNEESSVSEQIPSGEIGLKNNSRKRKTGSLKTKEGEGNGDLNMKKLKKPEHENDGKTEENTKPPEPPKDYIHVRARRGQATDSHSLAERVRREKISERMKLLQDLVPNCNKVTGKALMLDEIINYVQSLQRQVEFLSMKLATVNPMLDFDMNTILPKENNQQIYPIESSASDLYHQTPQVLFNGFTEPLPQFPGFGQDDLQSIVQMGFGENLDVDTPFLNGASSDMKMEL